MKKSVLFASKHIRIVLALFFLFCASSMNAATGDFDSRAAGNWSAVATWSKRLTGTVTFNNGNIAVVGAGTLFLSELSNGDVLMIQASTGTIRGTVTSITDDTHLTLVAGANGTASGAYSKEATPTSADGVITITHAITVTANVTVDQVVQTNGSTITINSGVTFTIADGAGTDYNNSAGSPTFAVNGTLTIDGTLTGFNAVTIASTGIVNVNGTFTENSGTTSVDVTGTLNVSGTYTGLHDVTVNSGGTINVSGALNETAGNPNATVSSGGNIVITGSGTYTMASVSQMDVTGTITMSGTSTLTTTRGNGGYLVTIHSGGIIDMQGTSSLTITGAATARLDIYSGATIKFAPGTTVIGSGGVRFSNGASMFIGSTNGISSTGASGNIQSTGTLTYGAVNDAGTAQGSNTTNYTYNGTSAQITGTGLPASLNNLTISNTGGAVSSTASVAVAGTMQVDLNAIFTPAAAHVISGAGTLTGSGTVQVTRTAATADFATQYSITTKTLTNLIVEYAGASESVNALTYGGGLKINNASGPSMAGAVTVTGPLTLAAGALSIGANTLTINGAITTTSGSLTGGASSNITIGGAGASTTLPGVTLNNLILNRSNGISLGGIVTVGGALTLTSGIMTTTSSNYIKLNAGATTSASSNTAFVNGPVRKVFNAAETFIFPVGVTSTGDEPLTVGGATASDDFTAEYIRASARALDPDVNSPIKNISNCEYWTLTKNSGGATSVSVTLSWDASSPCTAGPYVTAPSTLTVAHYNGTSWDQAGTGGSSTGNSTAGTVTRTAVTIFSPFTLGNTNTGDNPLPVRFGNVKAIQKSNGIEIDWTNYTESDVSYYDVEHSSDGVRFSALARVRPSVNDGSRADYSYLDLNAGQGTNFYRIHSLENSSKITYSLIVRVNASSANSGLNIYPNPVTGSQFVLQASNIGQGDYDMKIYNSSGQLILQQPFHVAGAFVGQAIQLPAGSSTGIYSLVLTNGEINLKKTFVIQ